MGISSPWTSGGVAAAAADVDVEGDDADDDAPGKFTPDVMTRVG